MISILIPLHNGVEFISESVGSVLNQTYEEWELLIGVNGHPENSPVYQTAKNYENDKIKVLDLFNCKGKSNTLNEMIKYCKYDYVALLDVDDVWHPQKLEQQILYLGHYDVIGTLCQYFGDLTGIVPKIPTNDISSYNFGLMNPIINSSAIIRKCYCYWNPEWDIEDYELWLRLRKKECHFYNIPNVLVYHRIHQQSAFNSKGNNNSVPLLLKLYGYR